MGMRGFIGRGVDRVGWVEGWEGGTTRAVEYACVLYLVMKQHVVVGIPGS